jgi:hypothetical protein
MSGEYMAARPTPDTRALRTVTAHGALEQIFREHLASPQLPLRLRCDVGFGSSRRSIIALSLVIASVVIADIALNAGLVYVLARRRAREERLRLIRSSVSFVRGEMRGDDVLLRAEHAELELTMKPTHRQSLRINTQAGKATRTQPQSVDLTLRLKRLEGSTQRVVRTYLHDLRRDAPARRSAVLGD